MKVLSLFSGIGAFEKALDNLNIPYELVGYCEIDKYASKSYAAIHGVCEAMNLGDITKVAEKALPKDIDLVTYGFPCQDISISGRQKGLFNEDGSQTRSGLFFEALRIIEETQPRVAIAENVKNLTSKKFKTQFQIVLDSLEQAGYNNYYQVLNAKDYGIPQNRERIFIVSIRKDIDTGTFKFPEGFPLELRLKDILENEVDEKYYIDTSKVTGLNITEQTTGLISKQGTCFEHETEVACTLLARDYKGFGNQSMNCVIEPKIQQVGRLEGSYDQTGRIYGTGGISPTIMSNSHGSGSGGYSPPKVLVREATKQGYAEAYEGDSINLEQPNSKTRRGRVGHGVAQTLTTSPQQAVVEPTIQRIDIPQTVKVRKYPVDCKLLCECLRDHKFASNFSNKDIAMELHVPITKVEHWFRQDDCFAVPDPDIWMPLKKLLGIETDEFDKSIMTFEEKEGVYEKSDRHYFAEGIAPTLTSTSAGNEKIIIDEPSIIEDFYKSRDPRIYNDVAPTLRADRTGLKVSTALRIRKLTPKECFRLMGFDDVDFAKAEAVNSNTQLYKQAGNSIVVPVIEFLIEALFECGAFDKRVEEAPTVKHRTVEQPKKELFGFAALLSAEDELALKEFFGLRNIEYKAI